MEQRDYIMRQIDQLGQVLGIILSRLIGYKNQGQIIEGIEITESTLKRELDLELDEISKIPNENFINILKENKKFTNLNFSQIADIILLIADELYERQPNNEKSKNLYNKSIMIFEHLNKTELKYLLENYYSIERIKSLL